MKKFSALLLALAMVVTLAACGGSSDSEELIVFAAASMTETLTELGNQYMAENENVTIVFNFDSSGTLLTQIREGADCDIFISAGQRQMDELDCILEGSRFDMLENKVALVVPEGNPAGIHSFDDMTAGLSHGTIMLAMGNADVPVGQYTQKLLAHCGLDEAELAAAGSITYSTNVKEIATQVSEAAVDCGVIYQTDAFSAGLTVVDTATAEMCGQVIYPAAVLNTSEHAEAAQDFLEFLTSEAADAVFSHVGFTPVV